MTSGMLIIPTAIRLHDPTGDTGCVHSHEIPEKTHPLLLPHACQAKLGMTKRVRDGSITLDDHDAQSLEVARQSGNRSVHDQNYIILYTTIMCAILF